MGRWRGHSPACHSAGPSLRAGPLLRCWALASVLDGDAAWGPPQPSRASAPCQDRISGRGPYPLFWVSWPHAANLPVKREQTIQPISSLCQVGGNRKPTTSTGDARLQAAETVAPRAQHSLASLNSDICVEPSVVWRFYNSRGSYYRRAQPVAPGSVMCSPELDLNFLQSRKPSLRRRGQHPLLPQRGTQLPQHLCQGCCGCCPTRNSIFALTAAPGRDAGLAAGQSKPWEPPLCVSPLPTLPGLFPSFSWQQPSLPPLSSFSPLLGGCLIAWLPSLV